VESSHKNDRISQAISISKSTGENFISPHASIENS
jgi:hypothetical protein